MYNSEMSAPEVIQACLGSDSEAAWTEFVRRFQPVIASVILRVVRHYGVTDFAMVDDLIQETYCRLCRDNCKAIRQFENRSEDAIFRFLKVVAGSVAIDYFRARRTYKRRGEMADLAEEALSHTAATSDIASEDALLLEEVAVCLKRITTSSRDELIFWLYYRQGFTAKDIAALPGIGLSAKGVESSIHRLVQALREGILRKKKRDVCAGESATPRSR